MSNIIRTFIAVVLDEDIRGDLFRVQESLKGKIRGEIRWVKPEAMHLTLKFLGNVKEEDLPNIYEATSKSTNRSPFVISLAKIGAFPNLSSPRVIWIGIEEGRRELEVIAKELDTELSKIGYPKEKRRFSPHLTLARVKGVVERIELNSLSIANYPLKGMEVRKIEVIKSDLRPEGAVYTTLKEFHFKL